MGVSIDGICNSPENSVNLKLTAIVSKLYRFTSEQILSIRTELNFCDFLHCKKNHCAHLSFYLFIMFSSRKLDKLENKEQEKKKHKSKKKRKHSESEDERESKSKRKKKRKHESSESESSDGGHSRKRDRKQKKDKREDKRDNNEKDKRNIRTNSHRYHQDRSHNKR